VIARLLPHCLRVGAAVLLSLLAGAARAHTEPVATGGFAAGLLHPLGGLDHLLAMVAVGIWGAALRAPLVWALPVVFPLLMVLGGVAGIAGLPVPFVEAGIAASVLALGLCILAFWRAPVPIALLVVGFFGFLHGYAHGTELPTSASPAAYSAGFVMSTGLLHLAGIAIGSVERWTHGRQLLRGSGGAIAAVGLWLLASRVMA